MKFILPAVFLGLTVLYFMGAAFHTDDFTLEMLIHNTVRFVSGFVFIGIWVWYKRRLKLKMALYTLLTLLVLDDIVDYFRNVDSLNLEMAIHDSFIVLWGALIGYLSMRAINQKTTIKEREQIPSSYEKTRH